MSKFFTAIAVDVSAVKRLLPPGAYVEKIRWDPVTNEVHVLFDHAPAHTGRDFAVPWPLELLKDGKMPEEAGARPKSKKALAGVRSQERGAGSGEPKEKRKAESRKLKAGSGERGAGMSGHGVQN